MAICVVAVPGQPRAVANSAGERKLVGEETCFSANAAAGVRRVAMTSAAKGALSSL